METIEIKLHLHRCPGLGSTERYPQNGAEANQHLRNARQISDEHVIARLNIR